MGDTISGRAARHQGRMPYLVWMAPEDIRFDLGSMGTQKPQPVVRMPILSTMRRVADVLIAAVYEEWQDSHRVGHSMDRLSEMRHLGALSPSVPRVYKDQGRLTRSWHLPCIQRQGQGLTLPDLGPNLLRYPACSSPSISLQ